MKNAALNGLRNNPEFPALPEGFRFNADSKYFYVNLILILLIFYIF